MEESKSPVRAAEASAPKSVKELLKHAGWRSEIAGAMPKGCEIERFIAVVRAAMLRNPDLEDCTVSSISQCLRDCASLGLEPDANLGRVYLIPFKNSRANRVDCQLIIGYRGLLELAFRSGKVRSVRAEVVHKKDRFVFELGLNPKLRHVPCLDDDPGPITHAYCVAEMAGDIKQWTVMTLREIMAIKARSKASSSGPWVTDFAEMAKKTVFRRLSKMLPAATEVTEALSREDESMRAAGVFEQDETTYLCASCGHQMTARAAALARKTHGQILCTSCVPDVTPLKFEDGEPEQPQGEHGEQPQPQPQAAATPPPAQPAPPPAPAAAPPPAKAAATLPRRATSRAEKPAAPTPPPAAQPSPPAPQAAPTPPPPADDQGPVLRHCQAHAQVVMPGQRQEIVSPKECERCAEAVAKAKAATPPPMPASVPSAPPSPPVQQNPAPAPEPGPGSPAHDDAVATVKARFEKLRTAQIIRVFKAAGVEIPPEVNAETDYTALSPQEIAKLLKEADAIGY